LPAAIQNVTLVQDTPPRMLLSPLPEGFGLATIDHEEPFQDSARVPPARGVPPLDATL
jgi:hypothetical protein